jgi:hypothetical protein
MANAMLKWFNWQHLPAHLQGVSAPLKTVAEQLDAALPEGPEKSAGMRKLLEAKDCFVRAAIDAKATEAVKPQG